MVARANWCAHGGSTLSTRWLGCPSELKLPLAEYGAGVSAVLQEQLVGVYVHGSVARGCANTTTSDVDVIVVMAGPCGDPAAEKLAALHARSGIALDATFITRSQLREDAIPTPVEFVLKPVGERKPLSRRGNHVYFLLDRHDAYECSIVLSGPPFREIAPAVPWALVAGCLEDLLPHILPKFKNPALMLCRIAYAFIHCEFCSKREAGRWALTVLDRRWWPFIETALARYAQGLPDDSGETEELRAFERECCEITAQRRSRSL